MASEMLFKTVPLLTAAILLSLTFACSDKDDQPSSTSPTATPRPAEPTPAGMTYDDHWFRGSVREMNTGCYVDAICSVIVEVTQNLGGRPLGVSEKVTVIESYGFSTRRCDGRWSETPQGTVVEVLAHDTEEGTLAVCDSDRYFVTAVES